MADDALGRTASWWTATNRLLRDAGQREICLGHALRMMWMPPAAAAAQATALRKLTGDDRHGCAEADDRDG